MAPAKMLLEMLMKYQHVVKVKKRLQEIQQMVNGLIVQMVSLSTHVVMVSTQELKDRSLSTTLKMSAKMMKELVRYLNVHSMIQNKRETPIPVNGLLVKTIKTKR